LKEFRSADPDLALLNENGKPLYNERKKHDGKVTYSCAVTNQVKKLFLKLNVKNSFLGLKKTSANKLARRSQAREDS